MMTQNAPNFTALTMQERLENMLETYKAKVLYAIRPGELVTWQIMKRRLPQIHYTWISRALAALGRDGLLVPPLKRGSGVYFKVTW